MAAPARAARLGLAERLARREQRLVREVRQAEAARPTHAVARATSRSCVTRTARGKQRKRAAHLAASPAPAPAATRARKPAKAARPSCARAARGSSRHARPSARKANVSTPALPTPVSARGSTKFRSVRTARSSTRLPVRECANPLPAWACANRTPLAANQARPPRQSFARHKASGWARRAAVAPACAWTARASRAARVRCAVRRLAAHSCAPSSVPGRIRHPVPRPRRLASKANANFVSQPRAAAMPDALSSATRQGRLGSTARRAPAPRRPASLRPGYAGHAARATCNAAAPPRPRRAT